MDDRMRRMTLMDNAARTKSPERENTQEVRLFNLNTRLFTQCFVTDFPQGCKYLKKLQNHILHTDTTGTRWYILLMHPVWCQYLTAIMRSCRKKMQMNVWSSDKRKSGFTAGTSKVWKWSALKEAHSVVDSERQLKNELWKKQCQS